MKLNVILILQVIACWSSLCCLLYVYTHRSEGESGPIHVLGDRQSLLEQGFRTLDRAIDLPEPPPRLPKEPPLPKLSKAFIKRGRMGNRHDQLHDHENQDTQHHQQQHLGVPHHEHDHHKQTAAASLSSSPPHLPPPPPPPKRTPEPFAQGSDIRMQGNDGLMTHPAVSWLPDPSHEAVVDDRKVEAFMDWGRGNLAFTLSNYRALESVLAHMPNTVLRVQSIAPTSAAMYRYANTLSWTQFKKYLKRGYDVQIELASSTTNVWGARDRFDRPNKNLISAAADAAADAATSAVRERPGEAYWKAIR